MEWTQFSRPTTPFHNSANFRQSVAHVPLVIIDWYHVFTKQQTLAISAQHRNSCKAI